MKTFLIIASVIFAVAIAFMSWALCAFSGKAMRDGDREAMKYFGGKSNEE